MLKASSVLYKVSKANDLTLVSFRISYRSVIMLVLESKGSSNKWCGGKLLCMLLTHGHVFKDHLIYVEHDFVSEYRYLYNTLMQALLRIQNRFRTHSNISRKCTNTFIN